MSMTSKKRSLTDRFSTFQFPRVDVLGEELSVKDRARALREQRKKQKEAKATAADASKDDAAAASGAPAEGADDANGAAEDE